MAPHSSTLAWKIPWTEEPGRLQSMGSLRVGHDWATSLSFFTFVHWRRKWPSTPAFLPGESQGWGSLVGGCLWGHADLDTTEVIWQQQQHDKSVWESKILSKVITAEFFLNFMLHGFSRKVILLSRWIFFCSECTDTLYCLNAEMPILLIQDYFNY